jgi:hypothetical protein
MPQWRERAEQQRICASCEDLLRRMTARILTEGASGA